MRAGFESSAVPPPCLVRFLGRLVALRLNHPHWRIANLRRTVPPEVEASYTTIIDSILAKSDLNTVSAKRIRKGLQAAVDYDLTPQKVRVAVSAIGMCPGLAC